MKFKKYSNGAWTDAPYYIMKNGSWTSTTDVHEMDNGAWLPISGWDGFRNLVRSGTASSLYPIGTELYETWGDNTSNAWIIVDYDNNDYMDPDLTAQGYTHNVILMEKNITQTTTFEDKQAWLYLTQALSHVVGTASANYRVTMPAGYDDKHGGNQSYRFTPSRTLSAEGQLTLTWPSGQYPQKIQGYATAYASQTAYDVYAQALEGGTNLGTIKRYMSGADSTYGPLNHIYRVAGDGGSNNYYQSSLRQWINATTAKQWWNPGCVFSRLWSSQSLPGKLYTLNSDMKSVLATPTIPCRTNNVFETGDIDGTPFALDTAYTVRDKMFIPSNAELGDTTNTPVLGSTWSYFTTDAQTKRIRTYNGTATDYWMRRAISSRSDRVAYVNSAGGMSAQSSTASAGVICACTIQ